MADRTQSYAAQAADRKDDMRTIVATIDAQRDRYVGILPSNVKFEDFRNAFLIAVQINPRLLEADRQSLWLALQKCAAGGLRPDNSEAALVIFGDDSEDEAGNKVASSAKGKKKVQYMPMVWGITKQMRNTGNVASVRCKVIYRGERVVIADENGQETYKHVRTIEDGSSVDENDENIVGAYAVVSYKDGFWDAEFMSIRQINRIKARAKSQRGPWATHFPQQAMKTPLRRLSLRVEKSAENSRYFQAVQDDETLQTIDGDPVVDVAQAAIEVDNSIKHEFTKPAEKMASKTQPTKQQEKQADATTRGVPADGGSGGAGAGTDGLPADDVTHQVEIWAVDEAGEPIEQMEPMSPVEFSSWFSARVFKTGAIEALMEHNADSVGDCRAYPEAIAEINGAVARHNKRIEEDAAIKAAATPAKATRKPIQVPSTPKGAQHWGNYGPLAQAEIAKLADEADIYDWVAVNKPTYKNRATEIAIENWIRKRRAELGLPDERDTQPPPTIPLTAGPDMTDAEFLNVVTIQMSTMNTDQDIVNWTKNQAVIDRMGAMRQSDKDTWSKVVGVIDDARLRVTPQVEGGPPT